MDSSMSIVEPLSSTWADEVEAEEAELGQAPAPHDGTIDHDSQDATSPFYAQGKTNTAFKDTHRHDFEGSYPAPSRGTGQFRVYMGNVPFDLNERAVKDFFGGLELLDVNVVRHRDTRKAKSCFVEFDSEESLKCALELDGHEVMGRPVKIQVAQQREQGKYGSKPGSGRFDKSSSRSRVRSNGDMKEWVEPPLPSEESSRERPKLNLKPRSEKAQTAVDRPGEGKEAIFGGARPIDTASKLAELELKDLQKKEELKKISQEEEAVIEKETSFVRQSASDTRYKPQLYRRDRSNRTQTRDSRSKQGSSRPAEVVKLQEESQPTKVANLFDLLAEED